MQQREHIYTQVECIVGYF